MARDDRDDLRIKPGRVRDQGTRVKARSLPFVRQVENAVRKAGGNPDRIGGAAGSAGTRKGNGSGRFNARGRGAKVVAAFPKDGGGWQRDSVGRFRLRRVVVKARVVKLNPQRGLSGTKMRGMASKAVDAHLRYLERDGVTRDGEKGRAYSAHENEADGRAFLARGREDRHQFRFIVAPEDATEMADLRGFTRDLMRQMEKDLGTGLDWIAVDHHNTGHPHTHILVRGATEDGKTLNIAGDYIAYGVRRRASELVTLELGHQSEIDVARKLANEVGTERLTRLDGILLGEQRDHGVIDLRPGDGASYLVRENRNLMIGRAKQLERFGLATEVEPGQWIVSDRAEASLKELGERNDVIKTMHRALADHGLAEERGLDQYVRHGERVDQKVVGRVLGKGLAGDEMGERVYLVVDGVDGRVHHMEFADPARIDELRWGMIVEAAPVLSGPRPADRNIAANAEERTGLYQPSRHLERIRDSFEQQGKDPDAFVRFHVRRLEALRRAGHVERIDEDHWHVPSDIVARGQSYDLSQGGDRLRVRVLSNLDLERQISSDGATWLDRELVARDRLAVADSGFGREVAAAIERRRQSLVDMGHATRLPNGKVRAQSDIVDRLERAEVTRVGRQMAAERGLTYAPSEPGEYVSGRLAGVANLASGRFAMIDNGLGFQLVPWQPVLDKRIGQQISGVMRDAGGIDWGFGKKRGLGL
ncbi:Type IV secretory pathway, VirD2 components (relaxase) [Rhizobiales bacterium GAS191]|nr:Type IV secretory pathway, VirD2 components (relaxase) [Rhizobiales bacterium GAS191]